MRMGASSNRQHVQRAGASLFVPYLPMAPIQIPTNNLLYDFSQTAIPTDEVDPEQIGSRARGTSRRWRGTSSALAPARRFSTTPRSS